MVLAAFGSSAPRDLTGGSVRGCSLLRVAQRCWADGANPPRCSSSCVVIYRWAVKVLIPPMRNARLFYEPGGPLRFCGEGGIPAVLAASQLRSSGPHWRIRSGLQLYED